MGIKKVEVSNFKSFGDLNIELGDLNVLIGANASGKSNFTQIFEFLRSLSTDELENLISTKGGVEYLSNINYGSSKTLTFKVVFSRQDAIKIHSSDYSFFFLPFETTYELSLKLPEKGLRVEIEKECLTQKIHINDSNVFNRDKTQKCAKLVICKEKAKEKKVEFTFDNQKPHVREYFEKLKSNVETVIDYSHDNMLIKSLYPTVHIKRSLQRISLYDINTRKIKTIAPITGKFDLEEDGSNLSLVLKNIMNSKDNRRKFINLLTDLLPFAKAFKVEQGIDKSMHFKLQESYFEKTYLPSFLLSDGTINLTALIIALYFESKNLIIIEEPERYIHPQLISKVIEMIKEASKTKQIILTTHHPEVVKHTGLENLLLVSRDEQGFSRISKPVDKDSVKAFLKNDIGIDDLFIDNFLS